MNPSHIKVLMISSDRNILTLGSAVSERMREYGALVEELHIVLFSDSSHGLKETKLASNIWVYPTNSLTSILRPFNAARLGKKIVFENKFVRGKSLITAQDPFECGWAGLRIKKKWRLPLEVQVHTDPFSPYFKGFQNKVRKFFARGVLRNADSVRVVSEELKQKLMDFTRVGIGVLPIYIDRERIENAPMSFDIHTRYPWHFILLAVSRLAPEKNLSLAIRVLAIVRQKFPDTGLLIVGSGPEESHLKSLSNRLGLSGGVEFAGWQENLVPFYQTANAFIQTSLFEGYGLSLIEAGLSGLPIITTPVGVAKEFQSGQELYLCEQGDTECFAENIIALIENNQKRENLRINMKKTLESKLLTKEDYLKKLSAGWEKTALLVR